MEEKALVIILNVLDEVVRVAHVIGLAGSAGKRVGEEKTIVESGGVHWFAVSGVVGGKSEVADFAGVDGPVHGAVLRVLVDEHANPVFNVGIQVADHALVYLLVLVAVFLLDMFIETQGDALELVVQVVPRFALVALVDIEGNQAVWNQI